MSYATQQDLSDRFGADELAGLTDRAGSGEIDAAVVARALSDATELVNGYLAKRYALPLSVAPDRLTGLVCDLARYALYTVDPPDVVKDRRKDAIAWLRDIAAGVVLLPAAGVEPVAGTGDTVAFEAAGAGLDRDSLQGWG
jgi:phage gp36-like protein